MFTRPTVERAATPNSSADASPKRRCTSLSGSVNWIPASRWNLLTQVRYLGEQFDDDQNSRVLAAFTVDLGLTYDFSTHASVGLRVENLFDQVIETGQTADGLVSIGAADHTSTSLAALISHAAVRRLCRAHSLQRNPKEV
ncbi:MAG: TonB-dependent receptor domain-containing protein [Chthoniobacterales bacterium]